MQYHPEHDDALADVAAELALERLRGRTEAVVSTANRLREEAERTVTTLAARQESAARLRPSHENGPASAAATPPMRRTRDTLQEIASGAVRLAEDADKVRQTAERHADLLRGTDLGYAAREAASVVATFSHELLTAASDPDRYEPFDAEQLQRLAEALGFAVDGLGSDYGPDAAGHRRLRGHE